MTQQTPDNVAKADDLLARLKDTSGDTLAVGVSAVERMNPEEEDGHKRGVNAKKREDRAIIRSRFLYFLLWLAVAITCFLSIGFLYLITKWVMSFWNDAAKLESFIFDVLWSALIIPATLFAQGVFSDDKD